MKSSTGLRQLLTGVLGMLLSAAAMAQVSINMATGTAGVDYEVLQSAVNRFMIHNPDVEVRVLLMPEVTNDRHNLLNNFLEVGSPELDVIQVDHIWLPELAPHLMDLSEMGAASGIPPWLLEVATVEGRQVGMPWYANLGVLFYRSDLLENYGYSGPPASWAELADMARTVQAGERAAGNSEFWGYLWQGAHYEGLTVNALEWLATSQAGTIIEADGAISVANSRAADALLRARSWLADISPHDVLTHTEPQTMLHFSHGNALFVRAWVTYNAVLMDSPRLQDRYRVAMLPTGSQPGSRQVGAYGGQSLAISAYSTQEEAARRLVEFLGSEPEQRAAAQDGSRIPTRSDLWSDEQVNSAIPFLAGLMPLEEHTVIRPFRHAGGDWSHISDTVASAVHRLLAGTHDVHFGLEELAIQLQADTGQPRGRPGGGQ